jgi:hypothetical protein
MLQGLLHPAQILMKQARQKDLAPLVVTLSISRTGDRTPKDSGGVNNHYKMCKEIMSKDDYSNDLRKEKKKGNGIATPPSVRHTFPPRSL